VGKFVNFHWHDHLSLQPLLRFSIQSVPLSPKPRHQSLSSPSLPLSLSRRLLPYPIHRLQPPPAPPQPSPARFGADSGLPRANQRGSEVRALPIANPCSLFRFLPPHVRVWVWQIGVPAAVRVGTTMNSAENEISDGRRLL
jgi:hypothetical protein